MPLGTRITIRTDKYYCFCPVGQSQKLTGIVSGSWWSQRLGVTSVVVGSKKLQTAHIPVFMLMRGVLNFWSMNREDHGWVSGKHDHNSCLQTLQNLSVCWGVGWGGEGCCLLGCFGGLGCTCANECSPAGIKSVPLQRSKTVLNPLHHTRNSVWVFFLETPPELSWWLLICAIHLRPGWSIGYLIPAGSFLGSKFNFHSASWLLLPDPHSHSHPAWQNAPWAPTPLLIF